jgi:RNA polymerase sigma-70 factor (ECF subfamily)
MPFWREISNGRLMSGKEEEWRRWMLAARRGDEASYKQLLADVARHVRPWARKNMRNSAHPEADLEDIVQETLLALHLKRHTWNADERFSPWLNAIVKHKVIDSMRRRAGRQWLPIDDFVDVLAVEEVHSGLERQDILKMAESLPKKQRAIVVAMFVDGHSTAEAASRFDMSEGAVRVTLHRALGKLAKRFGDRN